MSSMNIEERNQLRSELVAALCLCNGPRWNALAEKCREAGADYLLADVRGRWPVLAQRFDRDNFFPAKC